jgi:hypothetical protein
MFILRRPRFDDRRGRLVTGVMNAEANGSGKPDADCGILVEKRRGPPTSRPPQGVISGTHGRGDGVSRS